MSRFYYTSIPGAVSYVDFKYFYVCQHCRKKVDVKHEIFEFSHDVEKFAESNKSSSNFKDHSVYLADMEQMSKNHLSYDISRCIKSVESGNYSYQFYIANSGIKNILYDSHYIKSYKNSLFNVRCPNCRKKLSLKEKVTWFCFIQFPIIFAILGWLLALIIALTVAVVAKKNLFELASESGYGLLSSSAVVSSALGLMLAIGIFIREKLGLRKNKPENLPVIIWPDISFAKTEHIVVIL